jgi:hypothetical protein
MTEDQKSKCRAVFTHTTLLVTSSPGRDAHLLRRPFSAGAPTSSQFNDGTTFHNRAGGGFPIPKRNLLFPIISMLALLLASVSHIGGFAIGQVCG